MKNLVTIILCCLTNCVFSQIESEYQEINLMPHLQGFSIVDSWPQYQNGLEGVMNYFSENLRYPDSLKDSQISGKVIFSFIIQVEGKLGDIKIIESPHYLFSKEVVRVLETMDQWKPAIQRGEPVKMLMEQTITFKRP